MNKKDSSLNFNSIKSVKLTEYKKFASALKRLNQSKSHESSSSITKIFYPNSINLDNIQIPKERPIVNMKLPKIKANNTELHILNAATDANTCASYLETINVDNPIKKSQGIIENKPKLKKTEMLLKLSREDHSLYNLKLKARFQINELQTEGKIKLPLLIKQERFIASLLKETNKYIGISAKPKFNI